VPSPAWNNTNFCACSDRRNQFRAKPVNPVIFVNSTHGIKKVIPRECTVPEEFHMEIEQRLKQRHANEVTDKTESFEFHARPVPKAILDGPVVSLLTGLVINYNMLHFIYICFVTLLL